MFVHGTVAAKVILSPLFSDGMVLQQRDKVALWGKCAANKGVVVITSWNKKQTVTRSDAEGMWKVYVSTPKAGGPYSISFNDGETLVLNDVLIGEVWLCSGQSNMEMPLAGWGKIKNYEEEIAAANYPNIRLIRVERSTSTQPLTEAKWSTNWQSCSPATVAEFSAVAYFFARDIQQHHNVPIGLIQSAYSGTPAEAWVSGSSLHTMRAYDSLVTVISSKPGAPKNSHIPTVLFNAMISPLIPYGIRGVIWYQGEANAARANQYQTLFPLLINDWRQLWNKKEMPFYFVQLANYKETQDSPGQSDWAELREAQLKALSLPHTGMAVTIDIGEVKDIHPKNKQEVGHRLALVARNNLYHEKVAYSGPIYKSYKVKANQIELKFHHTNGGLKAGGATGLHGFAVAGADQKFYWASAQIKGKKVIVYSDQVTAPVAVRYAWAINPNCNLYNGAGLPASPFRTDNWKGITGPK
jgi:sialate O-acetylesterase